MLRRMMSDPASDPSNGALMHKPRARSLFHLPSIFVGFAAAKNHGVTDGNDSARSPTSPLDLKPFYNLSNSLLKSPRSPRSWDCGKLGLGIVDSLTDDETKCRSTVYSGVRSGEMMVHKASVHANGSPRSLPKNYGLLSRQSRLQSCSPEGTKQMKGSVPSRGGFGKLRSCSSADLCGSKQPGRGDHQDTDAEKFSRSLSASITPSYNYISTLSASEVKQSEDYTCIVSHGANPKTTHIFRDCILEHCTVQPFDDTKEGGSEEPEFYWLMKGHVDLSASLSEDLLNYCFSCKKKLEGRDVYIYRGEKAFCSPSCRDQEILIEEEEDDEGPASPSSSFQEDIFISGMAVAT